MGLSPSPPPSFNHGYGTQPLATTIPRNWWLGVETLATPTTASRSDKEPRTPLHSTLDTQNHVLPFAASPELPPDTLILFLEPDFVFGIEDSLRLAIDMHNEEKKRQKKTQETEYSEADVKAYGQVYRAWLAATAWKKKINSRSEAP